VRTDQTTVATRKEPFVHYEREYFFRLLWLFPLAFCFHLAEEAPGFPEWVSEVLGGELSARAFYRNNAGYMLLLLGLTVWASRARSPRSIAALFFWVSGQLLWNALFHVYTQHRFRSYSPGYFTAIFVYLPVYSYLTYLGLRERFLAWRFLPVCFVGGALGMAFTAWAGLYHLGPIPIERWW